MFSRLLPRAGDPGALRQRLCLSDNAQHVAMHAWAEVWLDGRWLSFDITNTAVA